MMSNYSFKACVILHSSYKREPCYTLILIGKIQPLCGYSSWWSALEHNCVLAMFVISSRQGASR